jgi:uncharacterized membrane protein YgcG
MHIKTPRHRLARTALHAALLISACAFTLVLVLATAPASRAQASPGPQPGQAPQAMPAPVAGSPAAALAAQFPIREAVNDYAGVLDADMRAQLADAAGQLEQQHHVHLNIVTVRSVNGLNPQSVSIAIGNNWQARNTAHQRNIQIFLDIDERKMRFEVSRSLETVIADGDVNGIQQDMTPMLREHDYGRALLNAVQDLSDMLAQKEQFPGAAPPPANAPNAPSSPNAAPAPDDAPTPDAPQPPQSPRQPPTLNPPPQ